MRSKRSIRARLHRVRAILRKPISWPASLSRLADGQRIETREIASDAARRAASLLRGGVGASRVWRLLGSEPDASSQLRAVSELIDVGHDTASALASLPGAEWRVLAAAWRLAEQTGAPFASVLDRLAEALSSLGRIADRREVLLAGPRATISLLASLPIVAMLLAALLGFDPLSAFVRPVGAIAGVLGAMLLLMGVRWANRLTNRLAARDWVAGMECELAWVALSGGAAAARTVRSVADCVDEFRVEWVRFSSLGERGAVRKVLAKASRLGAPAAQLLLAEAQTAREAATTELESEAERLGVRVLLPLGVCVLPSFVLLGVMPVLIAVLNSFGGGV